MKELGQNVHVVGTSNQVDEFVKTTESIVNHTRANCKRSKDIIMALRGPEDIDWKKHPDEPTAPLGKEGKTDFDTQDGCEHKVSFESFQRKRSNA